MFLGVSWLFLSTSPLNPNPGAELPPEAGLATSLPPSPGLSRSEGEGCSPPLLSPRLPPSPPHTLMIVDPGEGFPDSLSLCPQLHPLPGTTMVVRSRGHRGREERRRRPREWKGLEATTSGCRAWERLWQGVPSFT